MVDDKRTWLAIWLHTCFFTLMMVYWGRAFSCIRWFNWTEDNNSEQCWNFNLGGEHGKAVAVFAVAEKDPESADVVQFFV